MTLEDLFRQLAHGELSNIAVADASGTQISTIKKEKQNQIVTFLNEALKKLHSRLPLKKTDVQVTLAADALDVDFPDGALVVDSILTAYGFQVEFETYKVPERIYAVSGVLHFPQGYTGEVQVTFRMRHDEINPVLTADDLAQEISILPELEPALQAYIAYKSYGGMNSQDSIAISQGHRSIYEQVISEVMNSGILGDEILPSTKLEARGFV